MPRYLAIDADVHGLTVAAATVRTGSVHLEQTLSWSENPQTLSPSTANPLGKKFAELLKQAGIAPAPVLFIVGRDRVIFKEIKHPPSPPQDEPAVVRFQVLKELSESPDEGILDYVPLGADSTGERRALVAYLNNESFLSIKTFCDAAGLKLASVTPRPFALASAAIRAVSTGAVPVTDAADAAIGVLVLNDSSGEFLVLKDGQVRFSRFISPLAMTSEKALVGEMKRNMAVYSAQSAGEDLQMIYLVEGETGAVGWSGRLAASLPIPVYPFDPLSDAPAAQQIPPKLRSRFGGVVGLLAGKANIGPQPINFAQPHQPKAQVNPNRNRAAVAMLVGIVLLAGLGFLGYTLVSDAQQQTINLRAQLASLEEDLKAKEPDLKRLRAAEEFENRSVAWLDELYDLSVNFPDITKMKLTSYVGSSLPPPSSKDRNRSTNLSANVNSRLNKKDPALIPVAKVRLTIASANGTLPEELVRSIASESKFYSGVKMTTGPLLPGGSARSPMQQFFIDANIAHRAPDDYSSLLRATLPKEPEAEKPIPPPDAPPPANNNNPPAFDPEGGFIP